MVLSRDPHRWTAKQVGAYLRSMNLAEEYVRVFESEGVNGMVLMTLTKEELEGAPFHMKGFVPVRTVLGCISSLKEQLREEGVRESSSDGATKETSSEMSDTPPPAVEQVPQRVAAPPHTCSVVVPIAQAPVYPQRDIVPHAPMAHYVPSSMPAPVELPPVPASMPSPVVNAPPVAQGPPAGCKDAVFPAMPPPPRFPKGFTPDVAKPPWRRRGRAAHTQLRFASSSGIDLSECSELLYYT
eukprot:TRINITY_DN5078_c1_g1_i5.p1 TRINITY_DN5078_c1_g1~~TRINITY_DN5078_c1_g1_i5.p1  ORF type:complete len:241 (+),score=72.41 TRINITY_DN5078_c1_g1_i5:99-821(+)